MALVYVRELRQVWRSMLFHKKAGWKDVVPVEDGHFIWPKSDEQRVYEAIVEQRRRDAFTNVSAVARALGMDRKHVERVIQKLEKLGRVTVRPTRDEQERRAS